MEYEVATATAEVIQYGMILQEEGNRKHAACLIELKKTVYSGRSRKKLRGSLK